MAKKMGIFLAGGIIGAAIVYFTSPRSGYENRNIAKSAFNAVLDNRTGTTSSDPVETIQSVAKNVADQAQGFAEAAIEKGQEFYVTATSRAQEFVAGASEESAADAELREKIDAARQRIAEQVVKNAEESQGISEQINVAADAE